MGYFLFIVADGQGNAEFPCPFSEVVPPFLQGSGI